MEWCENDHVKTQNFENDDEIAAQVESEKYQVKTWEFHEMW